jgi:hypothetical protein
VRVASDDRSRVFGAAGWLFRVRMGLGAVRGDCCGDCEADAYTTTTGDRKRLSACIE